MSPPEYMAYIMHGSDHIRVGMYTFGTCFFRNEKCLCQLDVSTFDKKNAELARNNGTAQFRHCRTIVDIVPLIVSMLQDVVVWIATTITIAMPRIKSKYESLDVDIVETLSLYYFHSAIFAVEIKAEFIVS